MRRLLTLAMILTLAVAVQAQTAAADFEGGVNNGDWTFGIPAAEVIETDGGNPGGYLHNQYLDVPFPVLTCGWDAEGFTGDYVTQGVHRIAADFQCFGSSNQYIGEFYFCVLLRNNMGTPDNIEDDIFVYPNPENWTCPDIGEGWVHYEFEIPYGFVGAPGEVPADWLGGSYYSGNATFPADALWQDVIANVSRVEFWWNHPDWFAIFASFDVGVDNVIVEREGGVAVEQKSLSYVKSLFQ